MAARNSRSDGDGSVDATDDDGLGAAGLVDDPLEETSLEDAFDDEDDEPDTDELPPEDDGEDPTELTAVPVEPEEDDPEAHGVVAPPDASFDEEDEGEGIVAAVTGDDEEHEIEGLRDGEFVCRSCYMAKRDTQLADSERLLCRDCA